MEEAAWAAGGLAGAGVSDRICNLVSLDDAGNCRHRQLPGTREPRQGAAERSLVTKRLPGNLVTMGAVLLRAAATACPHAPCAPARLSSAARDNPFFCAPTLDTA